MSDEEEDSMSEGFSASEDDWTPGKDKRGGESSDDDDSDFEDSPVTGGGNVANVPTRKKEPKGRSAVKQAATKKRKPTGQSLRAKLYNKYRPPPKTFPSNTNNSPTASTSRTASKNVSEPNESNAKQHDDSSSESSVEDYLVNPEELDLHSSFFDTKSNKEKSPVPPNFECNAGMANLSDSGSEDNNESSAEERGNTKAFDFRQLLEKANSLERVKETIARRAKANTGEQYAKGSGTAAVMDVDSLLALGENQQDVFNNDGSNAATETKSTRVKKRVPKTRPTSKVVAGDTDDSDWEEVADDGKHASNDASTSRAQLENLEIHVEMPSKKRSKAQKQQQDLEMAFKRKLNRDLKERQLLLHKTSLLCCFGRGHYYNRLLNDTTLMQVALKLLPSKNAYPPERGTEIKYFESLVTWFKTAIKLNSQNLYANKTAKSRAGVKKELLEQLTRKEARCKQDMILIFVILLRGMGMQCRLVVNMQPLPLRPAQSDLLTIKLKRDAGDDGTKDAVGAKKPTIEATVSKNEITAHSTAGKSEEKNKSKSKAKTQSSKEKENMKVIKGKSSVTLPTTKPNLSKLSRKQTEKHAVSVATTQQTELKQQPSVEFTPVAHRTRQAPTESNDKTAIKLLPTIAKPTIEIGSPVVPKLILKSSSSDATNIKQSAEETTKGKLNVLTTTSDNKRDARSRSKSPKMHISPKFLKQTQNYKDKFAMSEQQLQQKQKLQQQQQKIKVKRLAKKAQNILPISTEFLKSSAAPTRVLRSRQKLNTAVEEATARESDKTTKLDIPQLDGADDTTGAVEKRDSKKQRVRFKKLQKSRSKEESDEDFEPSPSKKPKKAPTIDKVAKDCRVLSTDDESTVNSKNEASKKHNPTAADIWVEVWSDVEEEWICVNIFKGKVNSVESIRASASSSFAYVYAFQNDLSIKDVTARYCPNWTTTVRKARVEKSWLDTAISHYLGHRTKRDMREDLELRRIHEQKPLPTTISDFKDHPLYALERHLLKFQALYPPNAPTLGFVRGEPVYSRDCIHTLHSREIWLKQARTVKLGEQPYKIVKARPKWDRLTQTVIKDQPLDIFGYWQTQDYEPPTAENGLVPRNAYGNVELFKECMLPKKTAHLRLPGLNRICKKLGIDCANAVIGFDFHQGSCHPLYDGFIICEEFKDTVIAAWDQDQEDQNRKEQEKYEARVYGNWKKLIRGLLIRERLKKKYNF